MPAVTSVREKIISAVAAALENLDLGGTPNQTIQVVKREYNAPEMEGEEPVAFVLDSSASEETGAGNAPMTFYLDNVNVTVIVVAAAGEARDEEMPVTANRILGFVKKKLAEESRPDSGSLKQATPSFNWLHFTGNQHTPFGEGGNLVAVKLDCVVQFIHKDTDPFKGR